jgi:rhodanese-related sulfurtransferase
MMLFARTAMLIGGAALIGLAVNAARTDGVSIFAWQASTVCETAGAIAEVTPQEAQSLCADPTNLVIDVRTHEQFERGHIPEARHLPCTRERLQDQTFEELSNASAILVYGQTTEEALAVAESLAQRNLPVRVLAGGYPNWEAAGLACSSGPCEGCVGTLHDH